VRQMNLDQHLSKEVQEVLPLLLPQPTKGSNVDNKNKIFFQLKNTFDA